MTNNDYCSNTNIIIDSTVDNNKDTGVIDDDYDIDF